MDDSGGPPHSAAAASAAGAAAAVSMEEMMQRCQCPVCLLHFRNTPTKRGEARSLKCSHLVCTGCLTSLIGQGALGHCPVCHAAFNAESDPMPPVREITFLADGVGRLQAAFTQQEEDLRVALERLRAAEVEQQENHRLMRRATDAMQKLHAEKVARASAEAAAAEDSLQTARACTPPPDDVTTVTVHILEVGAVEDDVQTALAATPPRVSFAPGIFNDGAPGSAQQVAAAVAAAAAAPDVDFDVVTTQSPHSHSSSSASMHTARRCYSQSHNARSPVGAWAVADRGHSSSSSNSNSSSSSGRSQHYSAGVMTARRSTPPPYGRGTSPSVSTARSVSVSRGSTPSRAFIPASRGRNPSQVSFPNAGPSAPVLVARSNSRSVQSPSRAFTPAPRSPISASKSSIRSSARPQSRAVTPAPSARGKGGNAGSRSRHASPVAAVKRSVSSARSSKVSSARNGKSSSKRSGRATTVRAKRQSKASKSRGRNSSKSGRGRSAKKAPIRRSKRAASAEATRRIHAIYHPRRSV